MDASAPLDDLHQHPDFDAHIHRDGGALKATVWIFGTRHELEEVGVQASPEAQADFVRRYGICPRCERPNTEHIMRPNYDACPVPPSFDDMRS